MAVLILMSAYFSATETAFSSLNKTRLKTRAEKGSRRASATLKLAEDYDKLLSTILIGNNIVNIATASIGTLLFVRHYGDFGATLSTIVVTIVVLIFGEITPKSLAKDSPERFAMFSTPFLKALVIILTPVNWLFTQWKKLMSKIFRVKEDRRLTQDELLVLVDEVAQDGGIDEDESELLRSAIEFTDRDAEDILTHRVDLEAVPSTATKEEVAEVFSTSRFSRILVYEENIDNIIGIIHQKDLYDGAGLVDKPLSEIMTAPLFVTKSIKISDLLKLLQKSKSHIAVVSDEYGGTLGIVTMEDILEELVGEIWDEHDEVIEEFRKQPDGSYLISCNANLTDLYDLFSIKGESDSTTVSGWVMEEVGRVPEEGDHFVYENLDVTVTKVDHRRVLEIRVVVLDQSPDEEKPEK